MRDLRWEPQALAGADQPVGVFGVDGHDALLNSKNLSAFMGMVLCDPSCLLLEMSAEKPGCPGCRMIRGRWGHEAIGAHESNYGLLSQECQNNFR
ncbi:hypothetical protein GKA01_09870 [Gluconobacter kanchanaburiensis NBRC 103587]|uniref:Uncharacterized protein n=1 Tax=Gluconobacter kanchanaburiensis NBRC 103587 TaxID=1307948 RepID=A0A511B5Q0_9PROT|nr:hypothetical protein AA103587_0721 [Gluconobacter kanchanaburiensis NBRC 103587]GEK95790.1 hypothetical protein GKA01_09870 [Gluconobacter kanchanaburiensis NBRC 103587]